MRFFTTFRMTMLVVVVGATFPSRPADAQTLTVSAASSNITAAAATINGTVTTTNSATVRLFYGGNDGADVSTAWANSVPISGSKTNNQTYTTTLTGLSPGTILYFRARAQDTTGEAWSTASATFTTLTTVATAPDNAFREGMRGGTGVLSRVTIGGTPYTASSVILSNQTATLNNGTATFTPLYRTITLLDGTTNPVDLVICTNMPAVTCATNSVVGSAVTNIVIERVLKLTP